MFLNKHKIPATTPRLEIGSRQFISTQSALAILMALILAYSNPARAINIGVLEETVVPGTADPELQAVLRLLFTKTERGWGSLCDPKCDFSVTNEPVDWYVQHGGTQLASIQSGAWLDSSGLTNTGLLNVSSALVPIVGEKNQLYADQSAVPMHKPLVVTSVPLRSTVHTWKEVAADQSGVKQMWPLFHKNIPDVAMCGPDRHGKSGAGRLRYTTISDIEVDHIWESAQKHRLIHVRIKPEITKNCDRAVDANGQLWLHLAQNHKLYALPALPGDVADPIDFGDFGNDNQEVAIFQIRGNHRMGYVLYFNNFQDQTRLVWNTK
ncbi:hypothetical protein AAKU67_002064 [Oxalobacteraceae bacterium GrIS 2.11]